MYLNQNELTLKGSPDRLMDPRQAAVFLQVTVTTLSIWRSNKRYDLPYIKVGGKVRYRESDLEKFLEERTIRNK